MYIFGGQECFGPSYCDVAHFVGIFMKDVWIRTQRAAVIAVNLFLAKQGIR